MAIMHTLVDLHYLLFLPQDYSSSFDKKWPVIFFLHGAGERGTDISLVKKHGPPNIVEKTAEFPFIVVSPQCPSAEYWHPDEIAALVQMISAKYNVDTDRLYLTGLSMGGYGTWSTAMQYPDLFAAIVPVCGGGNPGKVIAIRKLPVWVFHGRNDDVVPIIESERMVTALKRIGGNVKFTWYSSTGHEGAWTKAYDDKQLYLWLLNQKKPMDK